MASPPVKAGERSSHETNRLTLRFKHVLAEDGYLRSQGRKLYRGAFIFLIPALMLTSAAVVSIILRAPSTLSESQRYIDRFQLYVCAALTLFLLLAMIICGALGCCRFGYRDAVLRFMEMFLLVIFITSVLCVVLTDRFYLTELVLRANPYKIWPDTYYSDSRILLVFVGIVVVTHLGTPVRWFLLVYLDITAALTYVLCCTVVGSSEVTLQQFNISLLVLIVGASSMGRRSAEQGERYSFALIAQERVLRVESQFQLNCFREENPRRFDDDLFSGSMYRSSLAPSTADTERVFNSTNFTNELNFDEIERLGRREGWLVDFSDLEVTRTPSNVLGEGSFGMVVEGKYDGALVAIKVPKEEEVTEMTESELRTQFNELRILRHLRHPNIVVFYGAATVRSRVGNQGTEPRPVGYLALVLERLYGMSLFAFVKESDQRPRFAGTQYSILLGACSALRYLHALTPHVVHGDLKPANIWVSMGSGRPCTKLLDYGLSRSLTKRARPLGGSLMWKAPEVGSAAPPGKSADVFSFARVMFFVLARSLPLTSDQLKSLEALRQPPPLPWPVGEEFPTIIKETIEVCSVVDPRARPHIFEVYDILVRFCKETGLAPFSPRLDLPCKPDRGATSAAMPSTRIDRNQIIRCSELEGNVLCAESTGKLDSVPEEPGWQGDSSSLDGPPPDSSLPLGAIGTQKLYESFHLTPHHSQTLTIVEAILRWNLVRPSDSCCRLHCLVETLRGITEELVQSKCSSLETQHQSLVQCKSCLLFDLDTDKHQGGLLHLCGACAKEDSHDTLNDMFSM